MAATHDDLAPRTVDLGGLPPETAAAIRRLVEALRTDPCGGAARPRLTPADFAIWPGDVIEPLTREAIYEDVG